MDIKRRDALTGTITSPLLDLIKSGTPAAERDPAELPTALDLPQVTASEVTPSKPTRIPRPDPQDARPGITTSPRLPATTSPTGSEPSHTGAIFPSPGRPLPRAARLTSTLATGTSGHGMHRA